MYVGVLAACMYVHHMLHYLWSPGEGVGFPGTGVRSGSKPLCRASHWYSEEQSVSFDY